MYTVGRIGSYISRGVYTVSAPFHPFGGAVDIIVVEQPDGSFKSSPWYVRFGKFQGVLKTREKVVSINVNGVDADFNMYLDHKGEAYFLTEADVEEGESASCPSSSGDESDGQFNSTVGTMKSQSCNDADRLDSAANVDASNGKMSPRTNSPRARILGLVFGRKSFKSDTFQEGEDDIDMVRLSSLERAEIAADLLEVKWSTNLSSSKFRKEKVPQISAQDVSDDKMANNILVDNEEIHVDLSVHDFEQNRNDQSVLDMECGSHFEENVSSSLSSSKNLESFVDVDISCLGTLEQVVESSTVGTSVLEKNCEFVSALSGTNDEFGLGKAYLDEDEHQTCSEVQCGKEFDEHQSCEKNDVALSGSRIPTEIGSDRVQSFIYCETSETSVVGLDGTNEKTQETLYLASGGCGEVHVHLETVHVTTELPKDTDVEQDKHIELLKELGKVPEHHSDPVDQASCVLESETDLMEPPQAPESSTGGVRTASELSSIKEVNDLHRYLESTGESQDLYSDCVLKEAVGNSPSECSEDEQFLFSDLDESKLRKVQVVETSSADSAQKRDLLEFSAEDIKKMDGLVNTNGESSSPLDIFGVYNHLIDIEDPTEKLRAMSNPIVIHKSHLAAEQVRRSAQSLPNLRSPAVNLDAHDPYHPLSLPLESNSKSMKWALFKKTESSWMKSDTDKEELLAMEPSIEDPQISLEQETVISNPTAGDLAKTNVSPGGSWRLWPFFRRSTCDKATQAVMSDSKSADAEIASASISDRNTTESLCKPKVVKKKIRVLIPSSEQLASLNLKEGKNSVTFAFSTAMLGKQEVDARIYLWKWNTRIVISDVDGTITKSDVLGQFMPLVGVDWLQTGVAHLFSAIKENGYQLLFLSARAIAQAYHTRRFLLNLKQDGKALPDGPIVISPDGLFPSLFREVIRRAPHEFKISCLEDIKSLFPSDCNPFYAGFGNRDTDEISYLKVGIPKGKIFIINPKGEVAVNHRVDHKTYTSLHALVHGMFPHTTSTEQEDFNEWNYWKLPLPEIDVSRC